MSEQQPAAGTPSAAVVRFNKFRDELQGKLPEFAKVLPPTIKPERFARVVQTAVSENPDLLEADRLSLFTAAMKCAGDALIPDGREATLQVYNTRVKGKDGTGDAWVKRAQYMPMYQGLLKRVRKSGEFATTPSAHVVHEGDDWKHWTDEDGEHFAHRPKEDGEPGKLLRAYAFAKTNDGALYLEVMTAAEVEAVRLVSKAANGPAWSHWYDEMAKKAVLRRLCKRLPFGSEFDELMEHDNDNYDLNQPARPNFSKLAGKPADAEAIDVEAHAVDAPPAPPTAADMGLPPEPGEVGDPDWLDFWRALAIEAGSPDDDQTATRWAKEALLSKHVVRVQQPIIAVDQPTRKAIMAARATWLETCKALIAGKGAGK